MLLKMAYIQRNARYLTIPSIYICRITIPLIQAHPTLNDVTLLQPGKDMSQIHLMCWSKRYNIFLNCAALSKCLNWKMHKDTSPSKYYIFIILPSAASLSKAEHVLHETNCWLFVAAQHPQANTHFIHYMSPRIQLIINFCENKNGWKVCSACLCNFMWLGMNLREGYSESLSRFNLRFIQVLP